MSFNREVDTDVAHIYSGIFLSHKRNEIVPFAEMWMDLEAIIQSRVSQKEKILFPIVVTLVVVNVACLPSTAVCKLEIAVFTALF